MTTWFPRASALPDRRDTRNIAQACDAHGEAPPQDACMETSLFQPTVPVLADMELTAEPGRTYVGTRIGARCRVRVSWPGPPSWAGAWFHERFPAIDWGSRGPACCNLAWALLFDVTDEPTMADDWYSDLAEDVLRHLPFAGFTLPESVLLDWLHLPVRPR